MENQKSYRDIELSVVVPVLDEADNIAPLIDEIRTALDGFIAYEIVYVDDGSRDDTEKNLKEIVSRFPLLRIKRHKETCGQSTAIVTGVKAARTPWIATLDGDGQNDPADIPKLWRYLNEEEDGDKGLMVVGYRRKRHDSLLKRISSKVANAVRSTLLKDNTPDTGSGLKLFSRETFLDLPYFDHMHRFLPALIIRWGGHVVSLEVNHRERKKGKSKYGFNDRLWVGITDLLGVLWLRRRAKISVIERKE